MAFSSEDLLERADELVARTHATEREVAASWDRIEARHRAREEHRAKMKDLLEEEEQRSRRRVLVPHLLITLSVVGLALAEREALIFVVAALVATIAGTGAYFASTYLRRVSRLIQERTTSESAGTTAPREPARRAHP